MSKKCIYKITILNWDEHNPKSKPGHPYIFLSKGFLDDVKIQTLPAGGKLLYLGLLLRRGDVSTTFIEASKEDLVRFAGGSGQVIERLLDQLQSFQLVTYEKFDSLILNIKEKKLKEKKLKEIAPRIESLDAGPVDNSVDQVQKKKADSDEPKNDPEANKLVWEAYFNAYVLRYKVEPLKNKPNNISISNFVKRVGREDAPKIIEFYLRHNDSFYLKSTHSLNLALRDAESLRTQWLKGRAITGTDIKNFERSDQLKSQLDRIETGEL
jgi:hypothetical protein